MTLQYFLGGLAGMAVTLLILLLSMKRRCRQCDQYIARAGAAEAKAEMTLKYNESLQKTNERLLLHIGVGPLEKTPEMLAEEEEEKKAAQQAEEIEKKGGRTYGI